MLRTPAILRDLPSGPPLNLDHPGRPLELLGPFLLPERIDRMHRALDARTAHITAILEHLHDPHNIGACIRTLDALGIHDLHIVHQPEPPPPERPPSPHPERLRVGRDVTRGSEKWLDVNVHTETPDAISALRTAGFAIAVTDIHGDRPAFTPRDIPVDRPLAVVFGNEHEGITAAARALADYRLILPMHGFVESLNVSVALALIMGRLRERVDTEVPPALRALPPHRRATILDRWICNDIPNLRVIVRELQSRLRPAADRPPTAGHPR